MKYEINMKASFEANIGDTNSDDKERLKNKISAAIKEIIYDFILEQVEEKQPVKVEVTHDQL